MENTSAKGPWHRFAARSGSVPTSSRRPSAVDADGIATIDAEVETVAIKRLALERLAAVPGIGGIVDRLRVRPASPMSDDGILDHLRKAYYQEPAFQQFAIEEREKGRGRSSCAPD